MNAAPAISPESGSTMSVGSLEKKKSRSKSIEVLNSSGMGDLTVTKSYKREPQHRVFVNRSLHLEKIKFFGFDMDYTLAVYKSPQFESMVFGLVLDQLIAIGYPAAIRDFEYDPTFVVRGLWFDTRYGNLLKVDSYGNLLVAVHGFKFLKLSELTVLYPNMYIQYDESRIYILNSLYHLPETYLLACLIDYFTNSAEFTMCNISEPTGVKCHDLDMSFKSIFQDCRDAFDWVHSQGNMKKITMANLDEYVHRDAKLPILLERLRAHGGKTFLLTNSEYEYTDVIMSYLLDPPGTEKGEHGWTKYFDYVVVDSKKPNFFSEGTILRQIDLKTGAQRIGNYMGPLQQGQIYSGGSCDVFSSLIGAKGKDVLYIGDHIFGDILKSKKIRGWRTFLVVPELVHELYVWTGKKTLYNRLQNLDAILSNTYRNLDSSSITQPDISRVQEAIREVTHEMDLSYGMLGSLFRSGSRQTFFAGQVIRYADVYASTILNLLHYPFSYLFKAPPMLMPHESTVDPSASGPVPDDPARSAALRVRAILEDDGTAHGESGSSSPSFDRSRSVSIVRSDSLVPHLHAETPRTVTHHHDEDDSDEEDADRSPDDMESGEKKIKNK